MATAQEKEALGLGPSASEEEVQAAIAALVEKSKAADVDVDLDAVRAEAKAEADKEAEARIAEYKATLDAQVRSIAEQAQAEIEQARSEASAPSPVDNGDGTHEVIIGIRAFPYYEDGIDPVTDRKIRTEKIATRGDKVVLNEPDYRRAVKFGAIRTFGDGEVDVTSDEFDVEDASTADVANWIQTTKPSSEATVDAANGDIDTARKLLEAENLATGGEPRPEVVADLTEIIDED